MTMAFFFFFWRGGGGVLAGEGRNRWNDREKNEPFEAQHQKEHRLDEMPVPPKTLKSASLPPPLLTPSSLPFLNYGGCYLSHFKSGRGGEGLFTFQRRWYSLFTEKHIQPNTLLYQPATILETACILCISLFESCGAMKRDNIAKWCLRVADLKLNAAILFINNHTASDCCCFKGALGYKQGWGQFICLNTWKTEKYSPTVV